jgi:hypothetical protein
MKCFYHPDADAVGLCKHCSRGVCRDCAAEREGGIACKDKHEDRVDQVSTLVDRNIRLISRGTPISLLAVVVYLCAALFCGYLFFRETEQTLRFLFMVMGAVMLVSAVANTRVLLTRRRPQKTNV